MSKTHVTIAVIALAAILVTGVIGGIIGSVTSQLLSSTPDYRVIDMAVSGDKNREHWTLFARLDDGRLMKIKNVENLLAGAECVNRSSATRR